MNRHRETKTKRQRQHLRQRETTGKDSTSINVHNRVIGAVVREKFWKIPKQEKVGGGEGQATAAVPE